MPHRPLILKNLPIIAPLIRLIPEKMHRRKVHLAPGALLLGLDVLQAVRLVPAGREDVEGDLPADGIGEAEVGELLFQGGDEGGADVVRRVVRFEGVAFGGGGVAAYGGDVDHAVAAAMIGRWWLVRCGGFEGTLGYRGGGFALRAGADAALNGGLGGVDVPKLDKGPPLDRDVDAGNVDEAEVDQLLVALLAEPLDEAVAGQRLAEPVRREAVFRKAEVEERRDGYGGRAELFLLLGEVGASDLLRWSDLGLSQGVGVGVGSCYGAEEGGREGWDWETDEADGAFVSELGEELEHFGGDGLRCSFGQ